MQLKNTRSQPEVLSFQTIRRAIGVLGMSLPVVLLLGGFCFGCHIMMESISHYYYTYFATVFTGTLCAVGLFLITYKGFGPLDDFATNFAGVCAFGVALFPTGAPENLCSIYGSDFYTPPSWIHYTFAALFFVTLALISIFLFTRTHPNGRMTEMKKSRNKLYRTCGWLMIIFSVAIPITGSTPLARYNSTFWLEMLSLWCFGVSWLVKGEVVLKDKRE